MGANNFRSGSLIGGQYRILKVLGTGGQGAVFEVEHLKTGRMRALKVLLAELASTPEMLARFQREARIGATIESEHIVEVLDTGVDEATQIPFLVMELLVGETLEARLRRVGAAPIPQARWVMTELCDAVAAAHDAGVVHRDLKPENVFIARRPGARARSQIKVLDFGIAKALQEIQQTNAPTTGAIGTPGWLAPEQTSSAPVGSEADVWALGLIAFYLLTGQVFWRSVSQAGDLPKFLRELIVDDIPLASTRLRERGGDAAMLPQGFDGWFAKCVAREPTARFHNARVCYAAFEDLFDGQAHTVEPLEAEFGGRHSQTSSSGTTEVGSSSLGPHSGGTVAASARIPAVPNRANRKRMSATMPIAAAAIGVVGIASIGAWLVTRRPTKPVINTPPNASSEPAKADSARPEATRTRWAVAAARGKGWFSVHDLTEDAARKIHHVRFTEEGGRVTKIERVDPVGQVLETRTLQYESDSKWQETVVSSANVLLETISIDGVFERHRARGGAPFVAGCAQLERTFAPTGEVLERKCENSTGSAIIDKDGCQILRYEYDRNRQIVAERCFLEDGTVSLDRYGAHEWRLKWNDDGRQIEWAGFDLAGHAVVDELDGCAKTAYAYDAAGNRTREVCIGGNGLAVAYAGRKAAKKVWAVDAHGCRTRESYLTADDQPADFVPSVFAREWKNDARFVHFASEAEVETIECAVLSREDLAQDGTVRTSREYVLDDEGRTKEVRCFKNGRPEDCDDGGGSRQTFEWNSVGLLVRVSAFNGNDAATLSRSYPHEMRYEYDSRGLNVRISFFDDIGLPAKALGGAWSFVMAHDELGSTTSNASFGVDGPVLDSTRSHRRVFRYDERHRLTAIVLLDEKGDEVRASSISIGSISWPNAASRVEIRREGKELFNDFFNWQGTRIESRDCSVKACHSFLDD
ncbi:MAG: serine/threonine-protein kinase [Polyangiaceae bacterium]